MGREQPSPSPFQLLLAPLSRRAWQRQVRGAKQEENLPVGSAAEPAAQLDRRHSAFRVAAQGIKLAVVELH
jgi:hypothetical protein